MTSENTGWLHDVAAVVMQLMRRIHNQVVIGGEEAVHGDLPSAIDDLALGPWHELAATLVAPWPYAMECRPLSLLLSHLESVSTRSGAIEAVVTARWLLLPSATPLWARGWSPRSSVATWHGGSGAPYKTGRTAWYSG